MNEVPNKTEIELNSTVDEPVLNTATSVKEITGLFKTVTVVPTKTPRSIYEQVVLYVSGLTNILYMYDTVGNTWITVGGSSGVYTPTLTSVANIDASTAYECQYFRMGNVVTVSGKVDIDATAAAATQLGVSLPVASNFGNAGDCAGTFSITTSTSGRIVADTTNDRAEINFVAVQTSNQSGTFIFSYEVI